MRTIRRLPLKSVTTSSQKTEGLRPRYPCRGVCTRRTNGTVVRRLRGVNGCAGSSKSREPTRYRPRCVNALRSTATTGGPTRAADVRPLLAYGDERVERLVCPQPDRRLVVPPRRAAGRRRRARPVMTAPLARRPIVLETGAPPITPPPPPAPPPQPSPAPLGPILPSPPQRPAESPARLGASRTRPSSLPSRR
jgi:hypothetical protein